MARVAEVNLADAALSVVAVEGPEAEVVVAVEAVESART